MNTTLFRLKRAHHSGLRLSRWLLQKRLTPARFDMLFVLHECDPRRFGILQKKLTEYLGVTPPVVSRMLNSLDDLGYVNRELDEDDGRRRVISLTPAGRALIRTLIYEILASGDDSIALDCSLGAERWYDPRYCRSQRDALEAKLILLTRALADRATLDHARPEPPYGS